MAAPFYTPAMDLEDAEIRVKKAQRDLALLEKEAKLYDDEIDYSSNFRYALFKGKEKLTKAERALKRLQNKLRKSNPMAKRKVSQKTLAALKRGRKTMAANRLAKKKAPARRRNPSSHMTFKSLAVGAVFVFASEEDPKFRFSGMARGPWVKVAPRTYEDADNGQRHRVGSINVKVILKNPAHGNFMNAIAAKARGGLGREAYQNPVRPLRNPTSPPLLQIASKHPRTRQIVYWGAFGWGPRNKALGFPSSAEAKKLALKMKRPVVIVSPSHTTVDIFGALNQ